MKSNDKNSNKQQVISNKDQSDNQASDQKDEDAKVTEVLDGSEGKEGSKSQSVKESNSEKIETDNAVLADAQEATGQQGQTEEEKAEELDKQSFSLNKNREVIAAEEKTPTEVAEGEPRPDGRETQEKVTEGETDIITSAKKDPKGAHWYVVHTYSGHEAKVATTLKQRIESQGFADRILEILVPTQEKIEIKEGKKNTVREKLFPGYILIKMILDDASWLAVRTTPGITSFVGNTNKPTPLPEAEVASIQRFMTMEAPKFKTTFSPGEAVKIVDGPFSDFLGSVSEIDDEKGKVKVLVSIFGRETPVELDFLQIAKL